MHRSKLIERLWLPAAIFILYLAAIAFRPLMPVDETRYMTVAWEMFLHHGWFQPLTLNFEPYHHKPPLLFWLINLSWSIFGVSRWAGLIPIALSSLASVYLAGTLGKMLFPAFEKDKHRISLIMISCAPFLMYSTLVMFDITLMAFVLLSLINLIKYSRTLRLHYAALMGLFLGLAVLTKGPVAYLYVMYPVLLAPLWMKTEFPKPTKWGAGCLLALVISAITVLCWLIPVVIQSDNNFAFWLIWNQTAGRVTGNFDDAHIRPITFYLPLLPLMIMPWIIFPSFWRSIERFKLKTFDDEGPRFLYCWLLPVFISFCLISGKQPHYLVPLLPGTVFILAFALRETATKSLAITATLVITIFVSGQAIASRSYLQPYDQKPIADYVQSHPQNDWAFVRNYHGEIGFLSRLEKPITNLDDIQDLPKWFSKHPNGKAVIKFTDQEEVKNYQSILEQDYRGRRAGIFTKG
ncbi:MAG: hypothetical protein DI586_03600 [Micavibrio aeruginosavorus]|uniref:Glycosyltransferase RgtA/B/C/D-like domain-containing protein n=1 Tax=Micavibrio aeruginosavorus TaxID=349221 RepID=A0A2W5FRN4_9BACT|nr:MAG: hypothetical protein DI586_03600 [Micavibrio aeruginosavorus]